MCRARSDIELESYPNTLLVIDKVDIKYAMFKWKESHIREPRLKETDSTTSFQY